MLPQYSDLEYANLCTEAGKNSDIYKQKVAWLQQKAPKMGTIADETAAMRLVGCLIHNPIGPLHIALIADNLNIFKKHYTIYSTSVNPTKLLDQACFCGSQAVAEFLLGALKLTYLTCGYERVLTYVANSTNGKWTKELVQHLASAGKKVPDNLAAFYLKQEATGSKPAPIKIW